MKHLQMLGVPYYMAWTPEAEAKADANPDLTLSSVDPRFDGARPEGLEGLRGRGQRPLVQGLDYEPVVVQPHAGTTSSCFGQPPPNNGTRDPELGAWECTAAPGSWTPISRRHAVDGSRDRRIGARVDAADLGTRRGPGSTP